MLGWHFFVHRQKDGGASPAKYGVELGAQLARWQTGLGGTKWLDELVEQQKAIFYFQGGYPNFFTARVKDVKKHILEGPPGANAVWMSDPGDQFTDKWTGHTVIDHKAWEECEPEEWLAFTVWDES